MFAFNNDFSCMRALAPPMWMPTRAVRPSSSQENTWRMKFWNRVAYTVGFTDDMASLFT